MSGNFTGITFSNQKVRPSDDAIIRKAILSDGVLTGCEISYSGSTLTMTAGQLLICGRQIAHPSAQNWAVVDAISGYARLLLTIDLTLTSTKDVFDQIVDTIEYSETVDGFFSLEQSDINDSGTKYQFVACVVSLGSGGITGIVYQAGKALPAVAPVNQYSIEKLWENTSPTSDFPEQTIAMDLSEYEAVYIEAIRSTDSTVISGRTIAYVGGYPSYLMGTTNQFGLTRRRVEATATGVSISGFYSANTSNSGSNEIPYRIYGIKGMNGTTGGLAGCGTGGTGADGEDGGYYIPALSDSGDLSWTPTKSDMPSVPSVNIKGEKGDTGATGPQGPQGEKGDTGANGTSPTHSWNGTTLTISSASGTSSANLKGDKGNKGDAGADGAKGDKGEKGDTGAAGPQGPQGEKGDTGATGPQGPQGEQGPAGADGAKGDKGDTGATGQRGTGLLPVTTAPSAYTTAVNGLTPAYRIALSTVKSQASTAEVFAGDTVQYSYYHYPVIYVDASYVYCGTRVSIRGATGEPGAAGSDASVTKESIEAALGYTPLGVGSYTPLTGKKIVYDGDSICAAAFGYPKLIADKTACIYENQAVGGARLCSYSDAHSVVDNLANLPNDGDIYCFQGGINDWWANTPVGTFTQGDYTGTVDATTVYGAMETIFRYALTNFFGKAICFVITHKIQNTMYITNSAGHSFWDYREAMINVCEKYSIPYYDAFAKSGLNGWHVGQKTGLFVDSDGTHPTEAAYNAYYVPQLIDLFESIIPVGDYEAPAKPVTYTNMLKTSVDSEGQPYNGGKGWKADTYLSYDGRTESSSTNYDVTGFIPAKIGDVVRLKNVQLCKNVSNGSKCIVATVKSDFSANSSTSWLKDPSQFTAAWQAVTNDAGTDVVQFTVPTALNNVAYIRLCCGTLTDASIITINEEID